MTTTLREASQIPGRSDVPTLGVSSASEGSTPTQGTRQGRSSPLMVLGALLVLFSAIGGGLLFWSQGRQQVVAVANQELVAGQEVDLGDLRFEPIGSDSGFAYWTRGDAVEFFQTEADVAVATRDIEANSLLAPEAVASSSDAAETSLVGVVLSPGGLPSLDLEAGDVVDVVNISEGSGSFTTRARIESLLPLGDEYLVTLEVPRGSTTASAVLAAGNDLRLTIPQQESEG